jgi:hypothetical protein
MAEERTLQEIQLALSSLIKNEIRSQLATPRTVRAYDGRPKPVAGNYSLSQSKIDNTGVLSASLQVYFDNQTEDVPRIVIDFGSADYWYYLDKGRKPGDPVIKQRVLKNGDISEYQSYTKYPPLDKIKLWIRQKPAMTSLQASIDTKAFLVSRSIARYGMYPNEFIQKALDKVQEKVEAEFEEYGVAVLLAALDRSPIFKSNNPPQ